jgi:hypothetical protein
MGMVGKGLVGRRFSSFGAIVMCSILLEPARGDISNGIVHSVIAPKPMDLPQNMGMLGESLCGAWVFNF